MRYLDLILACTLTLVTVALVVAFPEGQSPLRIALGLMTVLLAPGYVLSAALFPKKDDLDGVERLALTLGLSIAVVPLLGLVLNYTPVGIRLVPISVALTLFVLGMTIIAVLRRRLAAPEQFYLPFSSLAFRANIAVAIVVATLLGGIIALAGALRPTERFTEFYLLGPAGRLEGFPSSLSPGERFTLIIGIGNHEGVDQQYELRIPFQDRPISFTSPVIPAGERWEAPFTLTAPSGAGRTRLPFYLYRLGDTEPYRSLHLFVTLPGDTVAVPAAPVTAAAPPETAPTVFPRPLSIASLPLTALQDAQAAPVSAPPPPPAALATHQVQPGETLFGLALRYLGDGRRYPELFELNRDRLANPRLIPSGMVLRIPIPRR